MNQQENRMVCRYILECHLPEPLLGTTDVQLVVNYKDADGKVRRTVESKVGVPFAKPSIPPSELAEVEAIAVPFEKLDPVDIKVMGEADKRMTDKVKKMFEGKSIKPIVDRDGQVTLREEEVSENPVIVKDPGKFDDVA